MPWRNRVLRIGLGLPSVPISTSLRVRSPSCVAAECLRAAVRSESLRSAAHRRARRPRRAWRSAAHPSPSWTAGQWLARPWTPSQRTRSLVMCAPRAGISRRPNTRSATTLALSLIAGATAVLRVALRAARCLACSRIGDEAPARGFARGCPVRPGGAARRAMPHQRAADVSTLRASWDAARIGCQSLSPVMRHLGTIALRSHVCLRQYSSPRFKRWLHLYLCSEPLRGVPSAAPLRLPVGFQTGAALCARPHAEGTRATARMCPIGRLSTCLRM